jgi:multimeric flavodoxin WrbA
MDILAIAGSPREHGNSTNLLRRSIEGANERGHRSKLLLSKDLNVQPCLGCNGCKKGPSCVVEDDMFYVYEELRQADALILSTPIYFYTMSGWVKPIVDRMWALLEGENMNYTSRLSPGKKLYVITAQEEPNPADGQSVVAILERGFKWLGFELAGYLVAVKVYGPKDHLKQPQLLNAAYNLIQ